MPWLSLGLMDLGVTLPSLVSTKSTDESDFRRPWPLPV